MDAKELRIGNLVSIDGFWPGLEIHAIISRDFIDIEKTIKIISPISITVEWLFKLGFTGSAQYSFHNKLGGCFLTKPYAESESHLLKSNGGDKLSSFKFVHELQNIFFALTGEELVCK